MKKIISFALAVLLILSVFCGCDKNAEKSDGDVLEKIEIVNKSFTAVIYDRGEDADYWNSVIAAFETANPGTKMNATISKDAAYVVRDMILSGNSPDFVFLPKDEESGVTEALVKDRAMLSLNDLAERSEGVALSGIFDNNHSKFLNDGDAYFAPLFFEAKGLIYNKTLLSENRFSVPKTWDEFVSIAEACEDKKFSVFAYSGAEPDEFADIFAAALVPSIGTEAMNELLNCKEDAWKDNVSVKDFIAKIEKITKLVVSGSSTKSRKDVLESFKNGNALFISGSTKDLKELSESMDCGFALYPKLKNEGTNVVIADFSEMYIPVEAKNSTSAKDFILYLYGDEAARIMVEKLGDIPPIVNSSAAVYSSDAKNVKLDAYLAIEDTAFVSEFATKSADNETLADEFCDLVVSVFKGDVTSENFIEKMLEYIKKY